MLNKEYQYFCSVRDTLVADHNGEYAVIHGEKLSGVFKTWDEAFWHGHDMGYEYGTFVIQRCVTIEEEMVWIYGSHVGECHHLKYNGAVWKRLDKPEAKMCSLCGEPIEPYWDGFTWVEPGSHKYLSEDGEWVAASEVSHRECGEHAALWNRIRALEKRLATKAEEIIPDG